MAQVFASGSSEDNSWKEGFTHSMGGMSCDRCGALVYPAKTEADRHRQWDQDLLEVIGKVPPPGVITSYQVR